MTHCDYFVWIRNAGHVGKFNLHILSSCGKCSERFFSVFDISVFFPFSTSGAAWSDRFFSVFHSVFFPFSTRGSRDPWTPLRTPKFFNLSGSIFPRENPTKTDRFGHIWALNVPRPERHGQCSRKPCFLSVFHSIAFPFRWENALSVFHSGNGKHMEK